MRARSAIVGFASFEFKGNGRIVDSRQKVALFDGLSCLHEDFGNTTAGFGFDLDSLFRLDGPGCVDGIDGFAANNGCRDDGYGAESRPRDERSSANHNDREKDEAPP